MKKLNVKWLPETFAIVSLTTSVAPAAEICVAPIDGSNTQFHIAAPGKLIIISDGRELRANVAIFQ